MRFLTAFLGAVMVLVAAEDAFAFCRTTTCAPPSDFVPTATLCVPEGFTSCIMSGQTVKSIPLFWKSTCVGYSLQQDASKYATIDQATTAAAGAFNAWASAACPSAPSIKGSDLGPIVCGDATFHLDGTNQNVIVFRDAAWPHKTDEEVRLNEASPTVALTTVSFDVNTGEILDADVELNTADHKIAVTESPGAGVFDLESVLTHEGGHFIGLAHTPDATAVMYFQDEGGSSKHRSLAADDSAAVCAVYPSAGPRPVDVQTDKSGFVAAGSCDPAPRGGLGSACNTGTASTTTTKSGCSASPNEPPSRAGWGLGLGVSAIALARSRARRHSRHVSRRAL